MATSPPPTPSHARARFRRRRVTLVAVVALVVVAVMALDHGVGGTGALASQSDGGQPVDPSAFAAGACVAYPPTSGNRGTTVFLDAGHGGVDPGGVGQTQSGTTVDEATETLPVELDVSTILRSEGFRVVVSRTRDSTVARLTPGDLSGNLLSLQGAHDDVAARDVCADRAGADALVGIYYDAGASSANAGSITAYDADRPFAASSERLADLVQADVLAGMDAQGWGIPDDGVQTDDQLGSLDGDPASGGLAASAAAYHHLLLLGPAEPGYFTAPSTMPGAVIEPLYLTDPYEGSIAASAKGQQVIARGIATAVTQYFGHSHAGGSASPSS